MRRRQIRNPDDTVISFLARELPPATRDDAEHFAKAIKEAGERYNRYDERRAEWEKYSRRKASLGEVRVFAAKLSSILCSLDILTRDDLTSLTGPERIDCLVGLLNLVWQQAGELESKIQERGKPTDHASERWIIEIADIFENAFSKPPTVSGSGEDSIHRRGRFYWLLELGLPSRFARHGRLSLKHIQKLLKLRRPPKPDVQLFLRDVPRADIEQP
jgi:hypothetical protein